MIQQFAEQLAALGKERTSAESNVDSAIADIISRADEMAANTMVDEGKAPVIIPPAVPVVKPKPKRRPVVEPPVVETPVVPPKKVLPKVLPSSSIRRS